MKASVAAHIAEHLWEDTVQEGSIFDSMIKLAPVLEELKMKGDLKQMHEKTIELKSEIVARWANVILEVEKTHGL